MHTKTISLNGIELHYQIEGEGEPLLLLHGGTGCHEDWVYCGRDEFVQLSWAAAWDLLGA
jgi:pimeloyl-ACP methyl ester carboxylesterase